MTERLFVLRTGEEITETEWRQRRREARPMAGEAPPKLKCVCAGHEDVDAVGEAFYGEDGARGWYPYCEECLVVMQRERDVRRFALTVEDYRSEIGPFVTLPRFTKREANLVLNCIQGTIRRLDELTPHYTKVGREDLFGRLNALRTAFSEAVVNHGGAVAPELMEANPETMTQTINRFTREQFLARGDQRPPWGSGLQGDDRPNDDDDR